MVRIHNQEVGCNAENYFISKLRELKVTDYEYIDGWYDFEVLGQKIEIKSCRLTIKDKDMRPRRTQRYRIGRFDFTKEENRDKQYKEDIWIGFIVRHSDEFILIGLCKARELKKKRYISIHKLRNLKIIGLEEWIKKQN